MSAPVAIVTATPPTTAVAAAVSVSAASSPESVASAFGIVVTAAAPAITATTAAPAVTATTTAPTAAAADPLFTAPINATVVETAAMAETVEEAEVTPAAAEAFTAPSSLKEVESLSEEAKDVSQAAQMAMAAGGTALLDEKVKAEHYANQKELQARARVAGAQWAGDHPGADYKENPLYSAEASVVSSREGTVGAPERVEDAHSENGRLDGGEETGDTIPGGTAQKQAEVAPAAAEEGAPEVVAEAAVDTTASTTNNTDTTAAPTAEAAPEGTGV